MSGPGFAIVDVETTGLFPGGHDRVIEIAVVHADDSGEITGHWETLLNPGRDLGAQRVHGIKSAEILDAPTIDEIAGDVVALLDGRVPVAHNASFDSRFVTSELARAGITLDPNAEFLCTMQLARTLLPGAGRSLADCCAASGVEMENAHRALDDALAATALLKSYIALGPRDFWLDHIGRALDRRWPPMPSRFDRWMPRSEASGPLSAASFLHRITSKLPDVSGPAEHREYLAFLDRALIDRHLSAHESRGLVDLANELGIDRLAAERLHLQYFDSVAAVAWDDGLLTDAELADLALVADLLEVPTERLTLALEPVVAPHVEQFALHRGNVVVLTGEMSRPRAEIEAQLISYGLVPSSTVSKKVSLVVAADPDSLSGKARKGRDLGIVVVGEFALPTLLANVHP